MTKKNQRKHPLSRHIEIKQQHQRLVARQQALQWLAEHFPAAFDTQKTIAPLKIGILKDILEAHSKLEARTVSISKLREALRFFTRRLDYLTTLKVQEMRIDLFGNPISRVSDAEAKQAQYRIRKIVHRNINKYEKHHASKVSPKGLRVPIQGVVLSKIPDLSAS